jgi:hypothetical protein
MRPEQVETLAALFDGERVDPTALAEALKDPEAPALLADFAALRVLAQDNPERPGDEFYAAMASVLRDHRLRQMWKSLVWPAIAASLLFAAGLAGYWVRPTIDGRPRTVAELARPPVASSPPATAVPPSIPAPSTAPEAVRPSVRLGETPPPPATLRLRFSQWAPANSIVQPQ